MNYIYEHKDLFTMPNDYLYAHCISSDFVMGGGIALQFTKRGVKEKLKATCEQFWNGHGYCRVVKMKNHIVANLITKENVYDKPTYETLTESLFDLKKYMIENHINKVAMPLIGCGLDTLEWSNVEKIIKNVFNDTNFEIFICKWS